MCGIFGVFTDSAAGFNQKQMDLLGQSIIINQFRGTDSTGLFAVAATATDSELMKVVGGASKLFYDNKWEAMKEFIFRRGKIVVGHGRAATRGTVSIENAHPFAKNFPTGEKLKLVHNGTLEWDQDLPDFHKFGVDSEWIAEMLVRYGAKEALSQIRGAMALVWWNEKDQTINFYRNKERPLHFNTYENGAYDKTFLLASEAAAVKYLAERNGLTPMKKDTSVFYFAPHVHYAKKLNRLFDDWLIHEEIPQPKPKSKVWTGYESGGGYQRPAPATGHQSKFLDDADEVFGKARSYTKDLECLKKGLYKRVTFEKNKTNDKYSRTTVYDNYTTVREDVPKPYLDGLIMMERVWTSVAQTEMRWWVKIFYNDGEREFYSMVGCYEGDKNPPLQHGQPPAKKEDKPALLDNKSSAAKPTGAASSAPTGDDLEPPTGQTDEPWRSSTYFTHFAPINCQKFSPGRKIRWTSRSGNDVVRHKANIADVGGHLLKSYANSADGEFEIGDEVVMEVSTIEPVKLGKDLYYRFDGCRMSAKVDRCVDVAFYLKDNSEEAVELAKTAPHEFPFFKGKVGRIELSTKNRHEDTGSFVVLVLREVEQVSANSLNVGKTNAQTQASC